MLWGTAVSIVFPVLCSFHLSTYLYEVCFLNMRSMLAVDLSSRRKVPWEQVYSSTCTPGSK